jgi:molybdenum cofactor cytidylyltransferase
MLSAILLAAGESKRMGQLKQGLPLGNSTILEQSIDNLVHSKIDELIVVLGYRAQELREKVTGRPVKTVINPDYEQGMSTSIIAGLHLVDDRAQAVMFALADQPFIGSKIVDILIDEFSRTSKGIVIPTYRGRRGHPVIFAIRYKEELLRLKDDVGGRQVVKEHPDDVLEIPVDSEGINVDIDTVSDYYAHLD